MYIGVIHRLHPVIHLGAIMPNIKSGQEFNCKFCGEPFYRTRAYLLRGHVNMTCGKKACTREAMRGEGNPFWGKTHDEQTRLKIRAGRRANPPKTKTGPPKGWRQSPEAREKMRAALIKRWAEHRDVMMANLPRGKDGFYYKEPEERRYRKEWTPLQRKEWMADKCLWCGSTDDLTLDHIIPVMDGGLPEQTNAQTLCHPCNLWKSNFVDKPRYLAGLRSKGGQN
jgi:5-methylcytosine-specific restriction endonuclease McrA